MYVEVASPSIVGFVAIMISLGVDLFILSIRLDIVNSCGPIPFIGDIDPFNM